MAADFANANKTERFPQQISLHSKFHADLSAGATFTAFEKTVYTHVSTDIVVQIAKKWILGNSREQKGGSVKTSKRFFPIIIKFMVKQIGFNEEKYNLFKDIVLLRVQGWYRD